MKFYGQELTGKMVAGLWMTIAVVFFVTVMFSLAYLWHLVCRFVRKMAFVSREPRSTFVEAKGLRVVKPRKQEEDP